MSICEHMIDMCDSAQSASQKSPEEKLNIQNELIWGLSYRNYKANEKNKPIRPIHSPIDIPFEICRAEQMLRKRKKKFEIEPVPGGGKESEKNTPNVTKSKRISTDKPSLLDRSVWCQKKYMDFLSIPNPKFEEPKKRKYKKRCELEPCPPRFIQLAVPNKRKVFANWKEYAHFLPTEMLMRYEEILHSDQNLEPRDARYYYKKLDRQRRKELKMRKLLEKKKKMEKTVDCNFQKAQIELLAKDIMDYIKDEPLFTLNYKQMLLSDGILERLELTNIMKKPSRKTKNHYKKNIIEAADKFAIWIDTLTRFVDVQAIESDEDILPISISSPSIEGEGESSSEYESSSEEELREDQLFRREEASWGEEGDAGADLEHVAESIIKSFFKGEEGEGAMDFEDMLNDLDEDVLAKLIRILSNCSDDFLESEIDEDKTPGIRYIDVLNKLKELKEGLQEAGGKSFLEQIMIDWALRNDPDKVDEAVLRKIHEVAAFLGDWLNSGKSDDTYLNETVQADQPTTDVGEGPQFGGEDFEGQGIGGVTDTGIGEGEAIGAEMGEGVDMSGGIAVTEGTSGISEVEGGISEGVGSLEGEESPTNDINEVEEDNRSEGTFLEGDFPTTTEEAEGGSMTPGDTSVFSNLEGEEEISIGTAVSPEEEPLIGEEEEVSVLYEQVPDRKEVEVDEKEIEKLDGRIIKGHRPSKVFEHSPDTVCCLSLKTWAVWLLEITHNAHNWTQWMSCVIQKVKEFASIVRGDVKLPNGETKLLRKAEWREFIKETEENVIAWRQYSAHVKDLSQSIVENFHGKEVNCCPKCLQDHLIRNVVVAHDTLQALTEAISCAAYWQRSLDTLVEKTCGLAQTEKDAENDLVVSSEESDGDVDLEEIKGEESGESVYEIEGIESNENPDNK